MSSAATPTPTDSVAEAAATDSPNTPAADAPTPPPGFFAGIPFESAPFSIAPIQTQRLILRPLAASDVNDVWQYQKLDEVLRFIPWPPRSFEEAAAHTLRRAALTTLDADESAVFFACVLPGTESSSSDNPEGRVIGDVMLRLASVETAELEIGWVFHPDFAGQGYATEAAEAVLRLAFEDVGAHRVVAHLDPRNDASARLCLRLGLIHEGTTRQSYYDKGEWSDGGLYGMLFDEWRAREDAPSPHAP